MKTHHFLISLALLTVSCTKEKVEDVQDHMDDPTPIYPISIRAGQDTGVGIAHVDFAPDRVFNVGPYLLSDSISLDLDSDLTDDFMLTYQISDPFMLGSVYNTLLIRPLSNNQVCVDPIDNTLADSLIFNELIDSSRTWSNASTLLYHYSWSQSGSSSTTGYFKDNTEYYIGIRLYADGKTYYGWIYLNGRAMDKYGITTKYYNE